jgi:hypothetical protein
MIRIKQILWTFLLAGAFIVPARADFIFSSSSTNAAAGNVLNLETGQTGALFVWMSTNPGQTLTGVSYNVLSDQPSLLSAVAHVVENPGPRWSSIQVGGFNTSGNLLNNHRAFYLPGITSGTGIATSGLGDFVLHSELRFNAGANPGVANLSFTPTSAGVSQLGGGGNIWNSIVKGTAQVNVSAIPEPGALSALALGAVCSLLLRRRRV